MSLSKNINPSLVLVQPRKTRPSITERLLMGRKESNQTNYLDKTLCSIFVIGAHWNSLIELFPVSNLEAFLLRHKEHCHLDISLVNNCAVT